jgi:hypothetical protein
MMTQFSAMTSNLIAQITNTTTLPLHAQLMSNISVNKGGLGIQTPLTNTITSYMTNSKCCLQYARDGVWLSFNKTHPQFPPATKLLYNDWESYSNQPWTIFRKYLPTFNETAIYQPDSHTDYIYKASLNGSREEMKEHSSRQLKSKVLLNADVSPQHVQQVLPALLDKHTSMGLMTMSRIPEEHRIKNHTFRTALQRKLRLPILNNTTDYKCKCGTILNPYGDHCLGCKANHKTKSSNGIRDEIIKVFKLILPFVGMIDFGTQIESEAHNIVPSLPRLQPFACLSDLTTHLILVIGKHLTTALVLMSPSSTPPNHCPPSPPKLLNITKWICAYKMERV